MPLFNNRNNILSALALVTGIFFNSTAAAVDIDGTVETTDGTGLCSMVLASGQYMFTCNPNGPLSLKNLPTESNGTVKRQVYVDGFFPRVDILPGSKNETVSMTRSGTCPSYNTPSSPAFVPGSAGMWINISGTVFLQDSETPLCSMVLANGQYVFTCDGTGNYAMRIPLDNNGQFKLQVYADGFAPNVQRFDEYSASNVVRMTRSVECQTVDTTAPVITLLGSNPVDLNVGDTYVEPGATALDETDGDVSSNIVIDNSAVNTAVAGSYAITYNVTDASGNAASEVLRYINVIDINQPASNLSVTAISPDSIPIQSTIVATISGTGFTDGSVLNLINGGGPIKIKDVVVVDSSTITANIEAKSGGPKRDRVWDIVVTDNGITAILPAALTVVYP
jgi:hypothetical protein